MGTTKLRVYLDVYVPEELEEQCDEIWNEYKKLVKEYESLTQDHFQKLTIKFPELKVFTDVDSP